MNLVVKAALTRIDNQFQELHTAMANQDNQAKHSLQQIATSLIYVDQKTDHLYNGLIEFRKELEELKEKNNHMNETYQAFVTGLVNARVEEKVQSEFQRFQGVLHNLDVDNKIAQMDMRV